MPEKHHPRRGSLAYAPRKRASSQKPRIRSWPEEDKARLLGFAGYKAGMTHIFMVDDHEGRATQGQEINVPVTVLEVPPVKICGIRVYGEDIEGEKSLTEVWSSDLDDDLERLIKIPEEYDQEEAMEAAEGFKEEGEVEDVSAFVHTQPRLSSVSKKKPELMEIRIGGGSVEDKWNFSTENLGRAIEFSQVFDEGDYSDIFAISKGKGTEGPVQRWGVKVQPRKVQQARRHTGVLGPWRPSRIMRSVPMTGQTGYHQRMEYNKRILKVGEEGEEITPDGGFLRFGVIKNDYILIKGSVPGPTNRMIFLRKPMRKKDSAPDTPPNITYIDTSSQQG
ncbi:MAG: 50S ribosomal protein L3 [Candidatus Hadarchaeota archaeon]